MEVSPVNQDSIVDFEVSSFFNTKHALFIVDLLDGIVDMVVHYSDCIQLLFCSGKGELVVIIKVYGVWIEAIETSVWEEFVGSGGCGVVGKFYKRLACSPTVLPIMVVDA